MTKPLPTIRFCTSPGRPDTSGGGWVAIDLELRVFDETLSARLSIPDRALGLADVVPVARRLADEIVHGAIRHAAGGSRAVSCHSGCSACCRYLVPLSVPEALRMWNEIDTLPPRRRKRLARGFAAAAKRILRAGPPQAPTPESVQDAERDRTLLRAISLWYRRLNVGCPFLADDLCAAYAHRPIACREHLVVGGAANCADPRPDVGAALEMPVSLSEALARLAAEVEKTPLESVMLPLSLQWHKIHLRRAERTWPGPKLFQRFVAILHDLAAETAPAAGPQRLPAA